MKRIILTLTCIVFSACVAAHDYYVERLFWEEARTKQGWNLSAKIVENQTGMLVKCVTYAYDSDDFAVAEYIGDGLSIFQRRFFEYNAEGNLIAILTDDGKTTGKESQEGVTNRYVTCFLETNAASEQVEIPDTFCEYNQSGQKTTQTDSIGNITTYCYDELDRLVTITFFPAIKDEEDSPLLEESPTAQESTYPGFLSYAWNQVKWAATSIASTLNNLKAQLSYTQYAQQQADEFAEQIMGKGFLQFSGYYFNPIEKGTTHYGKEAHDKIRVTFINGILNVRQDLEEALKLFSSTHGDIPIHYVYRPTEGWSKDMLSSTLSKLGYTSPYAKLLAQTWKEMIEEMGGVGQGGKILHYAHSIGATDTFVARNLLTPEEREMVHVISIGSPTMISQDSGFADTINYVSKRDGVCLLDPVGYITGYLSGENIELIGTVWGVPLVDHTLYTDSYGGMIQDRGKEFIKQHFP